MSYVPVTATIQKAIVTPNVTASGALVTTFGSAGWNCVFMIDASGGDVDVTLPAIAAAQKGLSLEIVRIDATANRVSIAGPGGGGAYTLNGVAGGTQAIHLESKNQSIEIVNDGTNAYGVGFEVNNPGETVKAVLDTTYAASLQDDVVTLDANTANADLTLPDITTVPVGAEKTYKVKVLRNTSTFVARVSPFNGTQSVEVVNSSPPTFTTAVQTLPVVGGTYVFTSDRANLRWLLV